MLKNIKIRADFIYGKGIALKIKGKCVFCHVEVRKCNDVLWLKRLKIRVYSTNVFDINVSVSSKKAFKHSLTSGITLLAVILRYTTKFFSHKAVNFLISS